MQDTSHLAPLVTGLAFALAFIFGAVANRSSFCTMGSIVDIATFGDWRRMRMWLLAIAVAIAGTGVLHAMGLIDTAKTIYTNRNVPWLSHLVGGLMFGFGMTLGSGCGSKTLIRAGTGNIKSMIEFIEAGADPYLFDEYGRNAVYYATRAAPDEIDALAPLLEKVRIQKSGKPE